MKLTVVPWGIHDPISPLGCKYSVGRFSCFFRCEQRQQARQAGTLYGDMCVCVDRRARRSCIVVLHIFISGSLPVLLVWSRSTSLAFHGNNIHSHSAYAFVTSCRANAATATAATSAHGRVVVDRVVRRMRKFCSGQFAIFNVHIIIINAMKRAKIFFAFCARMNGVDHKWLHKWLRFICLWPRRAQPDELRW